MPTRVGLQLVADPAGHWRLNLLVRRSSLSAWYETKIVGPEGLDAWRRLADGEPGASVELAPQTAVFISAKGHFCFYHMGLDSEGIEVVVRHPGGVLQQLGAEVEKATRRGFPGTPTPVPA
jgi:hypothetical protein